MKRPDDEATDRRDTPWATLALILASVGFAFVDAFEPGSTARWAFDPATPSPLTALTSLFLHANLVHLLGNLVFLAAVGPKVEAISGAWRMLLICLGSGLAAVGFHFAGALWGLPSMPLVGASGMIAGLVSYGAVLYRRSRVPLFPGLQVQVSVLVGAWLLLHLVGIVWLGQPGLGGTAYGAHLGGFAAGLLFSLGFRADRHASRLHGREQMGQMASRSPAALLSAAKTHLEHHPDDVRAMHQVAQALRDMGETQEEAEIWLRVLSIATEQQDALQALRRLGALERLTAVQRLTLADRHRESDPDLALALLRTIASEKDEPRRPDALLALAELSTVPDEREKCVSALESDYPLHPITELARRRGLTL